jgi:hypothetical protein
MEETILGMVFAGRPAPKLQKNPKGCTAACQSTGKFGSPLDPLAANSHFSRSDPQASLRLQVFLQGGVLAMKEETRRAIAHAATAQINGRAQGTVYSFREGRHIHVSGDAHNFYDHDAGAHITGSGSNLYHHGTGAHISLNVSGNSFSGYDHGEGHHFSGSVNGSSVQLYDYGEGAHFSYQA